MVQNIASVFTQLEDDDFRLLNAIERGMQHNEWVPKQELPGLSRLPKEEVEYRIDRTGRFELIERKTIQYVGYKLRFEGYDALALRAFVKRDTVTQMGSKVDEGKESDIFKCRNDEGREFVVKFHREGYTNFRDVDRARDYTADKHHVSWMYTARKAAEREYDRLNNLYPDVSVPEPIDQNRHAIVMELFEGIELARARVDKPKAVFDAIVDEMRSIWKAGYVHADMSEYNVLVSEEGIRIIDWPQSVETDHPHSRELLERDVSNVLSYFRRKYPKEGYPEKEEIVERITG